MTAASARAATTRTQSAIEAIRAMIVRGDLRSGDRLQAQMLADRLGVSRTPVADALAALHKEGLVEYAPNCGYGVRQFDLATLMAAFDVRLTLEGLACRLVAEQGLGRPVVDSIRANLARTKQVLFGPSWTAVQQDEWKNLNLQFHDRLIEAAGNPFLTAGVADTRVPPLIYDEALRQVASADLWRGFGQEQTQQAFRDHERIFEAVLAGQGARAENMMKEHVFTNREKARRQMEAISSDGGVRAAQPAGWEQASTRAGGGSRILRGTGVRSLDRHATSSR